MKRSVRLVAAVCAVLSSGCGKGHFSELTSADAARTFRYPIIASPVHIDPALVEDIYTLDISQQMFEGLVKFNEKSEIEPNLATKWDIKDGGTTYVFHLKPGVKFTNGREVTAADFKFSLERACDPLLKSVTASQYLDDIVGVDEVLKGKTKEISGLRVIDDHTLEIKIDKPHPYLLGKLAQPVAYVVCKEALKPEQEMLTTQQMVGTGPFIADRYIEDQTFDMVANKNYHDGAPLIDRVERPILKDAATRLNKFKAHELDLVQIQRQDIAAVKADPALRDQLKVFPRPYVQYFAFNVKVYAPFKDRRVRQAFCMAIDTKRIVDEVLAGAFPLAKSILAPGVLGFRENPNGLKYDPQKARQLLAEAGYPNGAGLPPLEMYYRANDEDVNRTCQAAQSDLKNNLGIDVALRPLDWTTFLAKYDRLELSFFNLGWSADYLDPQDFISNLLTTTGADNKQGYSNPEVDALCAKADVMPEKDPRRLAAYAKAEDLLLQDGAWLPIYFQTDCELISPRVHGLRESVFTHLPHTKLSLGQ